MQEENQQSEIDGYKNNLPDQPVNPPKKSRFRLFPVLITVLLLIFTVIIALVTIFIPLKISGNAVRPFHNQQLAFAEKISYKIKDPLVGEAVLFSPADKNSEYIGIIVEIDPEATTGKYSIISTIGGKPWHVDRDKIIAHIYFPQVRQADVEMILPPKITVSPTPPVPTLTITPTLPVMESIIPTYTITSSNQFTAFIDGVLYIDENYNGVRDSYEKGLMGKDINIYKVNGSVKLVTRVITNDDGYYKAKVTEKARYQPQLGDLNLSYQYPVIRTVNVDTAAETERLDFGMIPLGARNPEIGPYDGIIQGITFSDNNRNGIQDTGEMGIHFYKINLYRISDNSQVATAVSGDNGNFTFSNLQLTSYRIEAYNPSGQYTITKSTETLELNSSHKLDNSAKLGVVKNY